MIGEINTTLFTEAGCKLSVFKYGTWWRWRISGSKLVCWDCAFCDHTEINCLFLLSFGCHLIELRTISISQTPITYYCSHFLARCGKLFSSLWWCARTLAVLQKVRVLRMIGRNLLMIQKLPSLMVKALFKSASAHERCIAMLGKLS